MCVVGISSSISIAKLATSTIVALGIPTMVSFNFFFSPSLKVYVRYTSFSYFGIITHNCKDLL
jgi:hypothetical protein